MSDFFHLYIVIIRNKSLLIFKVWVLKRFILLKIVFKKSLEWQWIFNNNCDFFVFFVFPF